MHFLDTLRISLAGHATPLALALAAPVVASAQVLYDKPGQPYVQNFDQPGLKPLDKHRGLIIDWADNEVFRGWHAAYHDGQQGVFDTPTQVFITEGRSRPDTAFYLYRTPTSLGDGALGSQPTDQRSPGVNSGGIYYGVCLVNAGSVPLTRLALAYRVELYRVSSDPKSRQSTLAVEYRLEGESLGGGRWTPLHGGEYITPVANSGVANALNVDGNSPDYATPFTLDADGFSLAPGQRLWIRWFDVNNRGVDHGIGLDDVSITLLP